VAEAFTVFWTNERWRSAMVAGHRPLPVLFGGPHLSEPSFRRAGVEVGDLIYPVAVLNREVFLVARLRVREMILLGHQDGPSLVEQRFPEYRTWRFLAPTCTDEVVIGMDGTVPRGDLALPRDVLTRLTFRSQRGERRLRHVRDGELTSSIGLQGIYRLAAVSATELAELVESAQPPKAGRIPPVRSARGTHRNEPVEPEAALF
jgi:hypothetical protein